MIPFDYDQNDWQSRRDYPDGYLSPWRPDKTVIHWGGGANHGAIEPYSVDKEMDVLRRWQRYHMDSKGWFDIAYNYAVGQTGSIYRLRGENRAGATSGDYENDGIPENHEARAVVWIGGSTQTPTTAATESMQRIIDAGGHDLTIGHRDVKGVTECPGEFWLNWIDQLGDNEMLTIVQLQEALITAGFDLGSTGADGKYGPLTKAAFVAGLSLYLDDDAHGHALEDHRHKNRWRRTTGGVVE